MLRTRLLIPLAAALALGIAAPAGATTYCVNNPSCVASGGTDQGSDAAALASTLSSAQGAAGKDRVEVGAGTYARAGGFSYSGAAGNELDLVGAGHGQSVLTNTTTGTTLNVNAAGSTATGFGVVIAPTSFQTGLSVFGAQSVAKDIAVTGQAGTLSATGAAATGGATLADSTITGTGHQLLYGAVGDGTLRDTTITTTDFSYGVYAMPEIHRVKIAAGFGILESGLANAKVDQVAISVPSGGVGIEASSTTFGDAVTTADHLTIVGAGDPGSVGAAAGATAGGANAHNAKLILRSSIVRGVGHSLARHASHGAADIEVDHSDFGAATTLTDVQPGGSGALTDKGGNVNVDPQFVSASDFRLQAGSPVIDAGATAVQPGESATDLAAAARLTGSATDMGAFEYQPPAPPSSPPSSGQSGTGTESAATEGGTGSGSDASAPVDAPRTDTPSADTPPASSPTVPPVLTAKRPRTCAQIAKAKHGRKARAKAKARCMHKRHRQRTHR